MLDWELDELFDLYRILEDLTMNPQNPDILMWDNTSKGIYSVKAGYNKMCVSNEVIDHWPWKLI